MNPAEAARQKHQEHSSRELRRNSLDGHLRSKSDGTKRFSRRHNTTRQSSTESSATSLDVRCACQYFQGDYLFPVQKDREISAQKKRTNLFTERKVVFQIRYVVNLHTSRPTKRQKWNKNESGSCFVHFLRLWIRVYICNCV